jgi:hypothetical protein
MLGGKKIYKTPKTKFRKNEDENLNTKQKKKHHDKSTYRLLRQQQKEEYVI